MRNKCEAATIKAAAKTYQGVTSEADSSLHITHSKHSYNVILNGQRVASFLSEEQANSFADKGWHE